MEAPGTRRQHGQDPYVYFCQPFTHLVHQENRESHLQSAASMRGNATFTEYRNCKSTVRTVIQTQNLQRVEVYKAELTVFLDAWAGWVNSLLPQSGLELIGIVDALPARQNLLTAQEDIVLITWLVIFKLQSLSAIRTALVTLGFCGSSLA